MGTITMSRIAAAAAGLAILGGGALGAGAASAGGDTATPKPGAPVVCSTTEIDGRPATTVPCSSIPTGGIAITLDANGDVRDSAGKVIGRVDPATGVVTRLAR